MRWLNPNTNSMDMSLSKLWEREGQGDLVCCSPCGGKESDTPEQLKKNNNTEALRRQCGGFVPPSSISRSYHLTQHRYVCQK